MKFTVVTVIVIAAFVAGLYFCATQTHKKAIEGFGDGVACPELADPEGGQTSSAQHPESSDSGSESDSVQQFRRLCRVPSVAAKEGNKMPNFILPPILHDTRGERVSYVTGPIGAASWSTEYEGSAGDTII